MGGSDHWGMTNPSDSLPYQLGAALGLRPLDRVQVNNRSCQQRSRYSNQLTGKHEPLPFWYFLFTEGDGRLVLRTPAGSEYLVDPLDVCDTLPGQPLVVRAMPEQCWLRWLSLRKSSAPAPPEFFAEAHVVYVRKDRWNRVENVSVRFLDPALNCRTDGRSRLAVLAEGELVRIAPFVNRNRMPVLTPSFGGNYSAEQGVQAAATRIRGRVRRFIYDGKACSDL